VPDEDGVVQRVVFIGHSARPVSRGSPIVAEVARLARAYVPDEAARINTTFDNWIRFGGSQRFDDAAAVFSAIVGARGIARSAMEAP
jgi:hypothetical protein